MCLRDINLCFTETLSCKLTACLSCTQVARIEYVGCSEKDDTSAAEALARALCQCPLLEELKLWHLYLGCGDLLA
jgi:hypothetical protein